MFSHGYGAHSEMGGSFSFSFFRFYLFIFRERGKEGEREGEEHQCVVASHAPPTVDLAFNPGKCSDWESNLQPFGLQAGTQSTEPHQPRLWVAFYCMNIPAILDKMEFSC